MSMLQYVFWVQTPDGIRHEEVVSLSPEQQMDIPAAFSGWASPKLKAHVGVEYAITPYGWDIYHG
jgi:hypothetical protein